MASTALQSGAKLARIVQQSKGWRFGAFGPTNLPDRPVARSVLDYIACWLEKFVEEHDNENHNGDIIDRSAREF